MIAWRRFSELEVWYYLIWNEKQTLYQLKGALEQKNTFWNDRQNYPTHKYAEMPNEAWYNPFLKVYIVQIWSKTTHMQLGSEENTILLDLFDKIRPYLESQLQCM